MIFPMNELKEYSVAILTNVAEIGEQIKSSIKRIANNNFFENLEQITESP